MNPTITALATVPACVAIVTLLKDLGLPSKFATLASVIVGIGLSLYDCFVLTGGTVTTMDVMKAVGGGTLLGLSAAGIYDGARLIGGQLGKASAAGAEKTVYAPYTAPKGTAGSAPNL